MTVCARWFLAALLTIGTAFAADPDGRFSHTLSAGELAETGVVHLTSDQLAVLDALVRRDVNDRLNGRGEEAPKIFSQRLTPDERRLAGLADLKPPELGRVDALVERYESGIVTRALLSPPVFVSRHANVPTREHKADRQIHGSFSMSFGWGSNGYSERIGSMEVHTELAPGLHLGVGYSRAKIKGGDGIYYYRDPTYRSPPVVETPGP